MHGEAEPDKREMNHIGMTQSEASELNGTLDAEGWAALLEVHHAFANAPLVAPSAGFGERVLTSLAARERRQARRRSIVGVFAFAFGSILFTALIVWLSPLGALTQANGWADLLNMFASSLSVLAVVLEIGGKFARAMPGLVGEWFLVTLSLVAFLMTIGWTRIVAGWTPLNRPVPV